MKELRIEHTFDFGIASLIRTREARYNFPDLFPEVDTVEETFFEQNQSEIHRIRVITMKNSLPSPADKVLNMRTLQASEETWQTLDLTRLKVIARMNLFNGNIDFHEESLYYAIDENSSGRTIDIRATASIPLIGKAIESILASEFKKRSDIDREIIIKLRTQEGF
ncbi:MAG: hypothetical protein KDK38_03100 [Leptospiraceae bacterium]|nr:hypothetical protein [Leptospiraceae bacterium]